MEVTTVRWEASMKQVRGPCSWQRGRILASGLGHPSWIPPTRGFLAFGGETNVKRSIYEMMNIFVVHILTNIYCYILNDLIIAESAGKKKKGESDIYAQTPRRSGAFCASPLSAAFTCIQHICVLCVHVCTDTAHIWKGEFCRPFLILMSSVPLCGGLLHRPGPWTPPGSRQVETWLTPARGASTGLPGSAPSG